jgi:hypothetical protein
MVLQRSVVAINLSELLLTRVAVESGPAIGSGERAAVDCVVAVRRYSCPDPRSTDTRFSEQTFASNHNVVKGVLKSVNYLICHLEVTSKTVEAPETLFHHLIARQPEHFRF